MYEFPFGAGQQLNLNWIINEIITLHRQLDPDYELPNFDTAFPYMNLNTLNLDWILRELKAIKDLAPTEDATLLKMVANALLAETYDAETQYNVDDIVYRDNEKRLFKCITATPAGGEAWDSSKWVEIDVGEVLTDLLVNGGTANAVTNVRYNNHKIQQEINGTYSDVITIEDTPADVSDRLPSSKAVYNLNGAINLLKNRRFVIIGDSYTEGYSPDNNVSNSWAKLFRQYLGLANADCEIVYKGGAGFVGNSQGKSFIDLLADSAISSPSTVTDIIVAGGYNDKSATEVNVKAAIATFCTNAKTKYPNAQVYIAEIGWAKNGTELYELSTLASKYLHGAAENGAVCISGAQYAMHNYYGYFSSDNIHPNQQGQSNIAYQMINFFNGSGVDASYPYATINITSCPFATNNVSACLGCDMNNDIINFSIKGSTIFSDTNGINMGAADGATLFDLGQITSGYIFGNAYNTIALPVSIQVKNNNVFYWCLGNMVIKNGHLYLAMRINENNDVLQLSSVTSLVIYRSGASFNALMC